MQKYIVQRLRNVKSGVFLKETGSVKERFFRRIRKTKKCWEWIGNKDNSGYGVFYLNGKRISAHRTSYILHYGDIKNSFFILHACDSPQCVNPGHLRQGTAKDNIHDCINRKRRFDPSGENHGQAKLTWDSVNEIRKLYPNSKKTVLLSELEEIAKKYSVTTHCVKSVIKNTRWKIQKPVILVK